MQKKILLNLAIFSLCGIILTTITLYIIQTIMARNTAMVTLGLQLDNVNDSMKQNELQIAELTQTMKEDLISRARALSLMIELEPGIVESREKLNEAAAALNVDEVHIIDENGILWWGTQPQYYGIDFATTDQTRPFLAILEDPSIEYAQDPMPNGSAGVVRQYAGVSLRNSTGIAQIGMVPERLQTALKNNQIQNVLQGIIVGNTGYIFAVLAETGQISSHPNGALVGALLPEPLNNTGFMYLDGQNVLYATREIDGQRLVAVIPAAELYSQRSFYTVIFLLSTILIFGAFCFLVNANIRRSVIDGISQTINLLEEITAGNLDIAVNIQSNAEFSRLSVGINKMLESIKAKMSEITSLAGDLRRFGAIVAIADAGIIVKDRDGVVLEWNIGAENILGYKPEAIIGKTTKAYAPESAHTAIDDIEEKLQKGEHIAHVEVLRERCDGRLIYCSASYTPIFDEVGAFIGSVAIFHDISDKKQIEQALHEAMQSATQANSAKSSFLANMSHEIRTPMNGIIGFAELALDDPVPSKTRDYLEKIKQSGEGLLHIINDVLDISKIEAGKMELESTPFSLHEVLKDCETITSLKANEKGVELYFYAEPPIDKHLLGDPTKLRQILLNLLANAVKFTNRGMVKLLVTISESGHDQVAIHFEVRDNGIGMTPEQIGKILEPFTQADNSTTRKYGGTGLGLTIAKNMVTLMGGTLKAESVLGVGSKFSFTLPFGVMEAAAEHTRTDIAVDATQRPVFSGDVLVCEDNDINQQVIIGHLTRVGLNASVVENGAQGVKAVMARKHNPFDLIFMDIHMPVMDGLEASQKLAEMGCPTPVVALTANAMSTDIEIYLKNGMCDYLAKPFAVRDLWKCLLKYFTPIKMVNQTEILKASLPEQPTMGNPIPSRYESAVSSGSNRQEDISQRSMTNQRENPVSNSMSYYPAHPAQNAVLNRDEGLQQSGGDEELYRHLLTRFYRDNVRVDDKIWQALESGDITVAHRLTHTLKGVAGTLGASALSKAAAKLEGALTEREVSITSEQCKALTVRLNEAMSEIKNIIGESIEEVRSQEIVDPVKVSTLLEALYPLLEAGSMESLDMLPDLREILPQSELLTEALIKQIEDCDFDMALETVQKIRG